MIKNYLDQQEKIKVDGFYEETDWEKVVSGFRRVCMLRYQGRFQDSETILEVELPKKIADWSQKSRKHQVEKKAELENMFKSEQKKVKDAWAINECLLTQFNEEVIPTICQQVAQEVKSAVSAQFKQLKHSIPDEESYSDSNSIESNPPRNRILFDDIPSVIDRVIDEQKNDDESNRIMANSF